MLVEAFQISEQINLKRFKSDFTQEPLYLNNYELFYRQSEQSYFYLFNYGVVVFLGYNDLEKSELLKFIRSYVDVEIKGDYREDLKIEVDPTVSLVTTYDSLTVREFNEDLVRIVMLNTAQSVALDYYEALGLEILNNTQRLTGELEREGKFKVSKTNLLKFIGRTLNIKNSIIDNLYIFDSPDIVWENEYLGKVDEALKRTFDLKMRYRDVDYKLKIVQENLTFFTDILQNVESTRLEWIIIVLIMIEVFNLLIEKIW
jgi:required for meiotic nuclear division protein 1